MLGEMLRPLAAICLSAAFVTAACSPVESASIAIRVTMDDDWAGPIRGFSQDDPPEWVRALVVRSSEINTMGCEEPHCDYDTVASVEPAWNEMEKDQVTDRRFLLLDVPPNAGEGDPYLLQVASVVSDDSENRYVDACGVIGGIELTRGEKKAVDLFAHEDDCTMLCADDMRCTANRWCLGFECQLEQECASDDECPEGARCYEYSCTGLCGTDSPECRNEFVCCAGVCAKSCAS